MPASWPRSLPPVEPIRVWTRLECALRLGELRAAAERVWRRCSEADPPQWALDDLLSGELEVWQAGRPWGAVQRYDCAGVPTLCLAGFAGRLSDALGWYAACEARARTLGVAALEIRGRRGWRRMNDVIGCGFTSYEGGMRKVL